MNWTRTVVAGVAAGIVTWLADYVLHGMIMGETYKRYDQVFTQTEANPGYFLGVAVAVGIFIAVLFAKTRASWAAGWMGGATFGVFFGLAIFFMNFYNPLVIDGFPYFLSWCWGGIGLICSVLAGAVMGAIVPRT